MSSSYFLKLNQFEGPLDLLLHLIRVHELDIFQIDLLQLTTQYVNFLRKVEFKDLQDASSFMDMAAALLEYKSKQLLPSEQGGAKAEGDAEEDEEDLAEALQRRLILYDSIKKAAALLAERQESRGLIQTGQEWRRLAPQFEDIEAPLRGEPSVLLILYEQMLVGLSERRPVTVKAVQESITVEEVSEKIQEKVAQRGVWLFQSGYPELKSRYELVAYVLSSLQLVRDRVLKIHQELLRGPMWLYKDDLSAEQLQEKIASLRGEASHAGAARLESAAAESHLT